MQLKQRMLTRSALDGIDYNQVSISELFRKYAEIGFIYPAKKALLNPYMLLIKSNWERLYKSQDPDLLWVFSKSNKNSFASISSFRHGNNSVLAQHLVSYGNPFATLEVMLAAQVRALKQIGQNRVDNCQNWFRPENKYPIRVFASFINKVGPQIAGLNRFSYFHQGFSHSISSDMLVQEIKVFDDEALAFIRKRYGDTFIRAEELGTKDINLSLMCHKYAVVDLIKSRKVWKVCDPCGRIVGIGIANRAPLGLNFSFLENRAYYLVDEDLEDAKKLSVLNTLHVQITNYYQGFVLGKIPALVDPSCSHLMTQTGAKYIRDYMQSIWLNEAFEAWYEHIESFLDQLYKRKLVNA